MDLVSHTCSDSDGISRPERHPSEALYVWASVTIGQQLGKHVDRLHKRNFIILHYEAARLTAPQPTTLVESGGR